MDIREIGAGTMKSWKARCGSELMVTANEDGWARYRTRRYINAYERMAFIAVIRQNVGIKSSAHSIRNSEQCIQRKTKEDYDPVTEASARWLM
jgi:hypothetical protein